ncbi:hypothetical protein [Chromobacterium haemolyticum]|uniref:hypothetical protein n=1 Tax=Chromobacterium haemolyticum TaxID=394935 RepID=UPI00244CEAE9|nr:hypothetical protein [Chromobacterium haemolyticum]MDH0342024.1 hypothetical protein [Chromobacterium haemolyticum]
MTTLSLFPETTGEVTGQEWLGVSKDKWGYPQVVVRLLPKWTDAIGWQVGWLIQVGKAVDEWHPNNPRKHEQVGGWPWYRLDELPRSNHYQVAAAQAGRAAKIVLEQMLGYVDAELHPEVKVVQEQIENQARVWLQ